MGFLDVIEDDAHAVVAELLTTVDHYLLPDRTESTVLVDSAWCRGCRAFAVVEKLIPPDELERSAREFFARGADDPIYLKGLQRHLHQAAQWRVALRWRRSPPRCLECGGTDYVVIPEDGRWIDHPGQPGRQVRRRRSDHVSGTRRGRLYDTEGRRIPDRTATKSPLT